MSTFSAMSTTIAVVSVGVPENLHLHAMNHVADEVEQWQRLFSRFRPDSQLSLVNTSVGTWTLVDEAFVDLLETAREAVFATAGRLNPAILNALEAHGYDRTIDEVLAANEKPLTDADVVMGEDIWTLVETDRAAMRVKLPGGLRIDFGGIAKGALADRLAARFRHWPGGAISIGGDMCAWGDAPDGDNWRVGIEHPLDPTKDIATVELPPGDFSAIATSSRTKRAWHTRHGRAHHLIDPFSGAPIDSSLLAVTACAPTAVTAEVVTKNLAVAAAHGSLTSDLLLDAHWALTISDTLDLAHIAKEAA